MPISVDEKTITFEKDPEYKKGEIVVSGTIEAAKSGFIRKIQGKKIVDGKYIYKTENAVLAEVFEKAHIYKQIKLNAENTYKTTSMHTLERELITLSDMQTVPMKKKKENIETPGVKSLLNIESGSPKKSITYSSECNFDNWIEIGINIEYGDVEFFMIYHQKIKGDMDLKYEISKDMKMEMDIPDEKMPKPLKFKPINFMAGGVPIVITNELKLIPEASAEINLDGSINISTNLHDEHAYGFIYSSKKGKVEEVSKEEYKGKGITLGTKAGTGLKGDASAELKMSVHLISKLYDSTGADISVGIKGESNGEIEVKASVEEEVSLNEGPSNKGEAQIDGNFSLSISPEIRGKLVVTTPIIDRELVSTSIFEMEFDPLWEKEWPDDKDKKDSMSRDKEKKKTSKKPIIPEPIFKIKKINLEKDLNAVSGYYEIFEIDKTTQKNYHNLSKQILMENKSIEKEARKEYESLVNYAETQGGKKEELFVYSSLGIERCDRSVFSYSKNFAIYGGGAHPVGTTEFKNYDVKTGEEILLDDLIKDRELFLELMESKIEKNYAHVLSGTNWELFTEEVNKSESLNDLFEYCTKEKEIELFFNRYVLTDYAGGTQLIKMQWYEYPGIFKNEHLYAKNIPKEKLYQDDKGNVVYAGIIRCFDSYKELIKIPSQLKHVSAGLEKYLDNECSYAILELPDEADVYGYSISDPEENRIRETSIIGLGSFSESDGTNEGRKLYERCQKYDGKKVRISIDPDGTWYQSDYSLPFAPRASKWEIIE